MRPVSPGPTLRRLLARALLALSIPGGLGAEPPGRVEEYRGIRLEARPVRAGDYYEVEVLDGEAAIGRIRDALDLIYARLPSGAARLEALKRSGDVIIAYDPRFPPRPASVSRGTVFAAFVPGPADGGKKRYPILVSRYIVKWSREGFASALVHEIVHGVQHEEGRLRRWGRLDLECEASLHQERALQAFGVDKRTEQSVVHRRVLQLQSCVPFIRWMERNAPDEMDLWDTLDPDVPGLLALFDAYTGTR